MVFGTAFFALLGIGTLKADPTRFYGWFLLGLAFAQLFYFPLIFMHELGHAIAGRLVGFNVLRIVVGSGAMLWSGSIRGVQVMLNAVPVMGYTLAGTTDKRFARIRRMVYVSGGVAANAALLILGLLVVAELGVSSSPFAVCAAYAFLLANGLMVVVNILPHQVAGPFGPMASDGRSLLNAIAASEAVQQTWVEGYIAAEWLVSRDSRDHHEALRWCDRGLEVSKGSWNSRNCRGITLLDCARFAEARDEFIEAEQRSDIPDLARLVLRNNVAYAIFLSDDRVSAAQADAYSKEAHEAIPWQSSFKGTRGAVLCWLGMPAEAIPLLRETLESETEARNQALSACALAMALHALGKDAEAQSELKRAARLDRDCVLLARASNECGSQVAGARL